MKLKQNFGLFFTKAFITLIDDLLKDQYTKYLKREDFLHLFYILDSKKHNENNLVELPSQIRKAFGRFGVNKQWKFPELVRICESIGILISTTYSDIHGYCKSYGYTNEFSDKLLNKEIEFQFCEISEKTYNLIFKEKSVQTDPQLLEILQSLEKLTIDLDKANLFAKRFKGTQFLKIVRDISNIYNNNHFLVEDLKSGRIFTSFNMMKKELREFCYFEGKPLISVDLKSSQPYLLASILLKENPNNKEVQNFYNLVTKKDLYDWLIDKWGGFNHMTYSESRTFAKKMLFAYLYKDNRGSNTVQNIISREFPEVYSIIKKRKKSEMIWLTLQKLESSIFIPVNKKWNLNGCFSVHDSVYFTEDIQEGVLMDLKERFQDFNLNNYLLI